MNNKVQPLRSGDEVPDFSTVDECGNPFSKSSLVGKCYLLYFYPRDNTPGCTAQACGFRDLNQEYQKLEVTVLGISGDSPLSHQKFSKKHNLPFPLLVDEEHNLAKAFGVFGKKKFMGRTFDGIHRTSFLIGANGKILRSYLKVKAQSHPAKVLSDLKETQ